MLRLIVLLSLFGVVCYGQLRPWTPRDSLHGRDVVLLNGVAASIAPDGKHAFILTNAYVTEVDGIETRLEIFEIPQAAGGVTALQKGVDVITSVTRTVRKGTPLLNLGDRSSSEKGAIGSVRWSSSGEVVNFLAYDEKDSVSLFAVSLTDGRVLKRAETIDGISWYAWEGGGGIYRRSVVLNERQLQENYPTALIASASQANSRPSSNIHLCSTLHSGESVVRLRKGEYIDKALVNSQGTFAACAVFGWSSPSTLGVVDLRSGAVAYFPALTQYGLTNIAAIWNRAGTKLIVASAQSRIITADTEFEVFEVDPHAKSVISKKIQLDRTEQGVAFGASEVGATLVRISIDIGNQRSPLRLESDGRWIGNQEWKILDLAVGNAAAVYMPQDYNTPPSRILIGSSTIVGKSASDSKASRTYATEIHWNDGHGKEQAAGLYLPSDRPLSGKVPLVVQAYYYDPTRYQPDGSQPPADAAQSLVSRGFAVLQLNILGLFGFKEGERFIERLEHALRAVERVAPIDRGRLGIIGFSRGGYFALYASVFPGEFIFGATVCCDASTGSIPQYLSSIAASHRVGADLDRSGYVVGAEKVNGGTLWAAQDAWVGHDLLLNADKCTAAVLFTYHSILQMEGADTTSGAFLRTKRAFEQWGFPTGEHTLEFPRERLAMSEASVDWMSFWLLDQENPDPQKYIQSLRWRKIRVDWKKTQVEEAAGKLRTEIARETKS